MRGGPNRDSVEFAHDLTGDLVDLGDEFNLVTEELESQRMLGIGRVDIHHIASHAKRAACKVIIVAIVLNVDKRMNEFITLKRHLFIHVRSQPRIIFGRPYAIYARDRRHDDHITTRKQGCRRLMPKHLDLLVDGGILLDIRITRRNIRLRLIVIVV